jgi:Ca-activated chloride channel family protein
VVAPDLLESGTLSPAAWALIAAIGALVLVALAEWIHAHRIRRVASLAFGPRGKPSWLGRAAPALRAIAASALAWGLVTLLLIPPKRYSNEDSGGRRAGDPHHVLLVLDVSPSMRLVDAGPDRKQSRMERAREVMTSFFDRVPFDSYRVSVIAVYNGAKPVVVDTTDFEVVRNILGDLPLQYAFRSGKTKLFDGLEEAAKLAKPWNPRSTTIVLISDGDTVPATGMPVMPASVRGVIVAGFGDPRTGKFIDGRQSRQDVPTLKQIAARLSGSYHDGNAGHIPSNLIADAFGIDEESVLKKLTRREYALIACTLGGLILACLPLLLHHWGTGFRAGFRGARGERAERPGSSARGDRRNPRPLAGVG